MDAARELAQLLEALGELLAGLVQDLRGGRRVVRDARPREAHLERDGDEPLLGAVVEVALEAPAGGVAGLDDARARGGQLVARVGARERERDELGEALEALLGVRGERLLALGRGDQQAPHAARDDDGRGDDRRY